MTFTQRSLEMVLRLAEALEVPLERIEAAQRARWAKIRNKLAYRSAADMIRQASILPASTKGSNEWDTRE